MSTDVEISVCDERSFATALEWLYRELPEAVRKDRIAATLRELAPTDLLAASGGGEFLGAVVARCTPGRVGWIGSASFASRRLTRAASIEVSQRLVAASVERLGRAGARLIQALVPSVVRVPPEIALSEWESFQAHMQRDSELRQALVAVGFKQVTDVAQMSIPCDRQVDAQAASLGLEWLAHGPETRELLPSLLQRTYEGSLDIPELDGVRPVEEVIEGYLAATNFDPRLWRVVRRGGELVGCVLVHLWREESSCELQYMGVVPEARGQGIGRALCVRAIDETRRVGADELFLCVDERNIAAKLLYESLGFAEIERRGLYLLKLAT